jgi:hypothetical protein
MEINDIQYELLNDIVRQARTGEIKRAFSALLDTLEKTRMPESYKSSPVFKVITHLIKALSEQLSEFIEKDDQSEILQELGWNNG